MVLGAVADNAPLGVFGGLVVDLDVGVVVDDPEPDLGVVAVVGVVVVLLDTEPARRFGGGGCCILNTGACIDRLVVGKAAAKVAVGVNGAGVG